MLRRFRGNDGLVPRVMLSRVLAVAVVKVCAVNQGRVAATKDGQGLIAVFLTAPHLALTRVDVWMVNVSATLDSLGRIAALNFALIWVARGMGSV